MSEVLDDSPTGSPSGDPRESGPGPPLRVALLTGRAHPRWHGKLISELAALKDCELVLVIAARHRAQPRRDRPFKCSRLGGMSRLYRAVDRALFRRGPDALDAVDLEDLVEKLPAIKVRFADGDESIEEGDVDRIRAFAPDVILCLGSEPRGSRLARLARFGVWAYRFGDSGASGAEQAGLVEVLGSRPATTASLHALGAGPAGEERVLYSARLKAHRLSVRRHGDHMGGVASEFAGRALSRLRREGSLDDRSGLVAPAGRSGVEPGDAEMSRLLVRFGARLAAEGIRRAFYRDRWVLAYSTRGTWDGHRPDLSTMRLIVPPTDRFWADPFPTIIDGVVHVYFEEYPYRSEKAPISVLTIDEQGRPGPPRRTLERDYHLSYPFVFSWSGELYMIPETTAVGRVELFRSAGGPDRWEFDRVLLPGVRAADVTLADHDGLWWLFACIPARWAHNDLEELHLFQARSPLGPWRPHPGNPIKSDVGSARPAGQLYRRDGAWYRPAQDCTLGYGHSIVLNRIVTWDPTRYEEVPMGRIDPGGAGVV